MQNKNRVYDKDLRRFIYPQPFNFKRESKEKTSLPKKLSFSKMDDTQNKNSYLHYQYTPSNYFQNRELNQNALGYPRDQGQFSIRGNTVNNRPFSYISSTYKPEGKIYHYSIASKREYNQGLEEDTSSGARQTNLTENKYPKLILDKKTYMLDSNNNRYKQFLNRKKEENILPNKVFISDTYQYNKDSTYKFRPSREKDGYKGGVINLNQNNRYTSEEALKKIVLIQKWWKKYLNNNRISYERYSSVVNRKSYSRNDSYNNNQGNRFIVQTTRVEVFKRPYMSIPIIKPEIITKENKVNFDRRTDEENLEIILDKDSLKQNMANIWNEDNVYTLADSLCILQGDNYNKENMLRGNKIQKYEDEIMKLKLALESKEKELLNLSNKLKSMQNKKTLMKRQLVDNLFINNHRNITIPYNSTIESNDYFEILPLEKEALQKQIIDSLFVPRISKNLPTIFTDDKTITEARDNLEILPLEKEPLKKQTVDDLFIEETFLIKPDNMIQNIDKLTISNMVKDQNYIESVGSLEIFPIEKTPLQIQFIDSLYIEKLKKPENEIQIIEKMSLFKTTKPQNIYENIDNIEISYAEEEKCLVKQSLDNLFIEKTNKKPINQVQNVDKLTIIKTNRPNNSIEAQYYFELLPKEKEPLKQQFVDDLFIEKIPYTFKNLMIEGFDGLTLIKQQKEDYYFQAVDSIFIDSLEKKKNEKQQTNLMTILKIPKQINSIEISESIFIPPKVKEPLQLQLIDGLFIENKQRPENKIQNIDKIQFKEKTKPTNIIDPLDSFLLLQQEKVPLIYQEIDSILLEQLNKPEIKVQSIDELSLSEKQKPELLIEENYSILLEQLHKPEIQMQSIDELSLSEKQKPELLIEENYSILLEQKEKEMLDIDYIEGIFLEGKSYPINELQYIEEINYIQKERPKNEISEKIELYIPLKEKEELLNQNIDNILFESKQKEENIIEDINQINIEEMKKPENIIQENDYLFIPKKEKIPNLNQSINSITIDAKDKEENIVQQMHTINLDQIDKPDNIIQYTEDLFIQSEEKSPHEFQSVDNILIEGFAHEENYLIQEIDEFTILKNFKLANIINKMDSIYIPRKIKAPLKMQKVDIMYLLGDLIQHEEYQIQEMDKITILKKPKEENKIEKSNDFTILIKKKDDLIVQNLEHLMIIKESKKEENKEVSVDNICIETLDKDIYQIESVEQMEILKGMKKFEDKNIIIENKDDIFIPHKEKEKLSTNLVESILIEYNKPDNIIEYLDSLLIQPQEKKEFIYYKCDDLPIEGIIPEINEIQKVDSMEILKTEKSFIHEIELIESMYIPPKTKNPLKLENIDNISYQEKPIQENQIELADEFNILTNPQNKLLNYLIDSNINFFIEPKKDLIPLELQFPDKFLLDGLTRSENEIQQIEKIEMIPIKKEKENQEFKNVTTNNILLEDIKKPENIIEQNIELYIKKKEQNPLEYQIIYRVLLEPSIKNDYIIQRAYEIETKKEILKIKPKNKYEIDKSVNFDIQKNKEEAILEYQILDRMLIEGINISENEIQQAQFFLIEKSQKINNLIIPENDINFIIEPLQKEPLQKQLTDSIFMEKIKREEKKVEIGDKNVLELTCNLFIKSKEKKDLELQNNDKLYIERLMPSFQGKKCIKEKKHSFILLKSKKEKSKLSLSVNNSDIFIKSSTLPFKKSAQNKIEKTEEINIRPIDINEEYIIELINKKNMDEQKFNLHSKKKEKEIKTSPEKVKIEFVKDRMDSLFFAGKENEKKEEIEVKEEKEKKEAKEIKEEKKEKEEKEIEMEKEREKEDIQKKKVLFINLKENRENDFFINKEIKPIIKLENKINHEESIFIPNEELTQDKIYKLFLEKWKKEKLNIQKIVKFKLERQKPKIIQYRPVKKVTLIATKLVSLKIEGNKYLEDSKELTSKRKEYIEQKDKIKPKSENIYIRNKVKPSDKKPVINLITTKPESLNLEGNITPEDFQELITLKAKHLTQKDKIQLGTKFEISIMGNPPKTINNIIPIYSDKTNINIWIKGKQKKPYIIENKGYFIINSHPSPSKNLIVRGTCFSFLAQPKKPGLVSQDFEIIQPKEYSKKNWNILNKQQRSQFFIIKGNDNKIIWNKVIKRQKCVKFNIPPEKVLNNDLLCAETVNNITLCANKPFEQEIKIVDSNYNSLEKGKEDKQDKQKRVVKSIISKVNKEPIFEDSQEEFDPFSCCKKRETTKYDKLFRERKTTSALMKENNEINSNVISPVKQRITENIRHIEDNEIKLKEKKERKSDINLIENKNKIKIKLINKDNNINYKNNLLFKKKEKKTEYLRDFGTNEQFYN